MAFTMSCASNCGTVTITPVPQTCEVVERMTSPSRLIIIPCDAELPYPIKGAIKPFFEDGTIVASPELANWDFPEPTITNNIISACRPARRIVTGRTITAQDRAGITTNSGSPATIDKYAEYPFYRDLLQKDGLFYVGIVHCNGDVFLAKDWDDTLTRLTLNAYISYETIDSDNAYTIEVKNISMAFTGDPFRFNAPDFNIHEEGIVL